MSTTPGPALRGIVRLSGPHCWKTVRDAFGCPAGDTGHAIRRGRLTVATQLRSVPATVWWLKGPRTYTCQDMVEIHLPGSPPLLEAALRSLLLTGARLAQPGEFTLRAFLAGRLDLTQAEAVLGLIEAEDRAAARVALDQLTGGLSGRIDATRNDLVDLCADVEASLDFAEEDIQFVSDDEVRTRAREAAERLRQLERQMASRQHARHLARAVLVGPPNVGKSSLLNALADEDHALVTPRPGTTRDFLCATLVLDDTAVELVDTAGAAPSLDPVNRSAQALSQAQIESADVLLWCIDGSTGTGLACDRRQGARIVPVLTKGDLPLHPQARAAVQALGAGRAVTTSAVTGRGLADLKGRLVAAVRSAPGLGVVGATSARCRASVTRARACLEDVSRSDASPELLAVDLHAAVDALGDMLGATCIDDVLDRVFCRFCIGK